MSEINILQYGDFGKQVDDELALMTGLGYESAGLARIVGVIGTYAFAEKRARLARSMLDALGRHDIRVAYGEDPMPFPYPEYELDPYAPESYEFYTLYPTSTAPLPTAKELAGELLESAADNSITLTLQSPMEDAAQLLSNEPRLAKRKLAQVVIHAGILADANGPILSAKGYLQPDASYNNACNPDAATYVYEELQGRGIPATFVSRHATRNKIWASNAALTSLMVISPIGKTIEIHARMTLMRNLKEISSPTPGLLLKPNISRDQFIEQFFDDIPDYVPEVIWDSYTDKEYVCDPLSVAAAIPTVRDYYMTPYLHVNKGVPYQVVGLNKTTSNLRCAGKMRYHLDHTYLRAAVACGGKHEYPDGSSSYVSAMLRSSWNNIHKPGLQKDCGDDCDHAIPADMESSYDRCRQEDAIRAQIHENRIKYDTEMGKILSRAAEEDKAARK